jgi:hypothetical protein
MTRLIGLLVALVAALLLGTHQGHSANPVLRGVREIDLRSTSGVARRVTDQAQVVRIVRWLDALPNDHRRGMFACPMIRADSADVRFVFHGATGSVLARARLLDAFRGVSGVCNPMSLEIRGHPERELIGGRFLLRVQRLLGTHFG